MLNRCCTYLHVAVAGVGGVCCVSIVTLVARFDLPGDKHDAMRIELVDQLWANEMH